MDKAREAASCTPTLDYPTDGQSILGSDMAPPSYRSLSSPNALKIARLVAFTLVTITFIVGLMVLMGVYIRSIHPGANCQCDNLQGLPTSQAYKGDLPDRKHFDIIAPSNRKSNNNVPLPLNLIFDGDTGRMLRNNEKANVNCIVERKRATQLVSQEPKMIMTPFGNMSTDPRLVHVVGEKMIFSCSSENKRTDKMNDKKRPKRATGMCSCNCAC